ncbi:MAG: NAD(P)H-dependent flavin oxidoreductase [Syntrophobacteraceae bacterium]
MLKTMMTEMFGIDHPIQCGTLQWLSRAELVAAVANSGGLACIAAASFPKNGDLAKEIARTKELTNRPFGVNISLFPPATPEIIKEQIRIVIDMGIHIIETSGRSPEPYRNMIIDGGMVHIHKCARVKDAIKADTLGVDAISIVGGECGGHPGMAAISSMVLIPLVVDSVRKPIIAGGGICDGKSMMAALALGATGVNMGTRFIATHECMANERVKQCYLDASETETCLVMESLMNPGRVLRTEWAEKVLKMEKNGSTLEDLYPMISGQLTLRGFSEGLFEEGLYPAGQVVGRIKDIVSVSDLIKRIVNEALEVKDRLDSLFHRV